MALDGRQVKARGIDEPLELPGFMPWPAFYAWFAQRWQVGEHLAVVGETGSGKTTLVRSILQLRSFVVVLGTKSRDKDLYGPLESIGFERRNEWSPYDYEDTGERYVIFAPPLDIPDRATERELAQAEDAQAAEFRVVLVQINKSGGWCVDADEIATITNDMGLKRTVNLLYREGRSKNVSIVAGTQRPREVPLNVFQQAQWFFLWRISDKQDRDRAAEYTGALAPVVSATAAILPRHEFVCIHRPTGAIVRSKVSI